jgi:hypothetical protein
MGAKEGGENEPGGLVATGAMEGDETEPPCGGTTGTAGFTEGVEIEPLCGGTICGTDGAETEPLCGCTTGATKGDEKEPAGFVIDEDPPRVGKLIGPDQYPPIGAGTKAALSTSSRSLFNGLLLACKLRYFNMNKKKS